jgi:hypothetical protein
LINPDNSKDCIFYPLFLIPKDVDIAIKPIPRNWYTQILSKQKDLSFFDLDNYIKPEYSKIKMLHAFGWLNDHKVIEGDKVLTLLADSYVELTTQKLDERCLEFQLQSETMEPHNLSFSGMSGGPVVYRIW